MAIKPIPTVGGMCYHRRCIVDRASRITESGHAAEHFSTYVSLSVYKLSYDVCDRKKEIRIIFVLARFFKASMPGSRAAQL